MSGSDVRALTEGVDADTVVDLSNVPTTCVVCPDVETHVRLTTAGHATDADDLRLIFQVLGLAESPAPPNVRTGWGHLRSKDRRRGRAVNETKENHDA